MTSGEARGARVAIDSGYAGSVYGGDSQDSDAVDNSVTLSGGTVTQGVVGGYALGGGNAIDNHVIASGGVSSVNIVSGYSENGNAVGNTVTLSGATANSNVFGGFTGLSGDATSNTVTLSAGTINGEIYGGFNNSGTGNATGNTVILSGGTANDAIHGGYSNTGDATGNRVILEGNPTLGAAATIYGGLSFAVGADDVTGNVLEVHTKGLDVPQVLNFDEYHFLLPANTTNGDVILNITGGLTDLGTARVGVLMQGSGNPLASGARVALIHNGDGVVADGVTQLSYGDMKDGSGNLYQGVSLQYDFTLASDPNNLYAVVTSNPRVSEQAKAPVEGTMGAMGLSLQGADLVAGEGTTQAVSAASGTSGFASFGALSGGRSRYATGSHVDVNGTSLVLGLAKRFAGATMVTTAGAFVEGGWSHYTTHNRFDSGAVRGDGHSHYIGGGLLAHLDGGAVDHTGPYAEASIRVGRLFSDWGSGQMRGARSASYDTSTTYYGANIGLGYRFVLGPANQLDAYAKYFWTHQNAERVTIAGDPYRFDATDSQRTRLGLRLSHGFNEQIAAYAGAAWEHEYDGVAHATTYGMDIAAPSLRGDTGVFEVGLTVQPNAHRPLQVSLGVEGYTGMRRGLAGTARLHWTF